MTTPKSPSEIAERIAFTDNQFKKIKRAIEAERSGSEATQLFLEGQIKALKAERSRVEELEKALLGHKTALESWEIITGHKTPQDALNPYKAEIMNLQSDRTDQELKIQELLSGIKVAVEALKIAHDCATYQGDGECSGCQVSRTLTTLNNLVEKYGK